MRMRRLALALAMAAGCVGAAELPKFEVDVAKWRESMGMTRPVVVAPQRVVMERPETRCAVRLREVPVKEGARVRVVEPEEGRVFAHREAWVPAEACGQE